MLLVLVYLLFAIYKWYEFRDKNKFISIKYTKQLFDSIRETNAARSFIIKYLFQRITFCLIAALWVPSNTYPKLGVYSSMQLVFFIYIIVLRPFDNIKDNLLEIVNEGHYVVLTSSLLFLNSESKWSQTMEIAYIAIIFSNNIIVCLLGLLFLVRSAAKSIAQISSAGVRSPFANDYHLSHLLFFFHRVFLLVSGFMEIICICFMLALPKNAEVSPKREIAKRPADETAKDNSSIQINEEEKSVNQGRFAIARRYYPNFEDRIINDLNHEVKRNQILQNRKIFRDETTME